LLSRLLRISVTLHTEPISSVSPSESKMQKTQSESPMLKERKMLQI
jgi:hypothetical protein